jgi:hypothetical protein
VAGDQRVQADDPAALLLRVHRCGAGGRGDGVVEPAGDEFGFPSAEPPPDFAILTVTDLFDEVQAAIDAPADDLMVEYDPETGIPTLISVDQILLAVDDEFTITSRGFSQIPGAAERAELEANRACGRRRGSAPTGSRPS